MNVNASSNEFLFHPNVSSQELPRVGSTLWRPCNKAIVYFHSNLQSQESLGLKLWRTRTNQPRPQRKLFCILETLKIMNSHSARKAHKTLMLDATCCLLSMELPNQWKNRTCAGTPASPPDPFSSLAHPPLRGNRYPNSFSNKFFLFIVGATYGRSP